MDINELIEKTPAWLSGDGDYPELVISSRARLARNIKTYKFPPRMSKDDRQRLLQEVFTHISAIPILSNAKKIKISELPELDRQFLIERHLVSRDLLTSSDSGGVIFNDSETVSVVVNEEDHIRIQVIAPGFALRSVLDTISELDYQIGLIFPYAFDSEFGYLTSCPTNTGLGLRFSVLLHLPAIVLTKNIEPLVKFLIKEKVGLRGLYGEGSDFYGNLFQVYTQLGLGVSEHDLLQRFTDTVHEIIQMEKDARKTLTEKMSDILEDRIARARATLENANLLSFSETAQLTSFLRLAVGLGKYLDIRIRTLNELLLFSQPAHIQKLFGQDLDQKERDKMRARYARTKLHSE